MTDNKVTEKIAIQGTEIAHLNKQLNDVETKVEDVVKNQVHTNNELKHMGKGLTDLVSLLKEESRERDSDIAEIKENHQSLVERVSSLERFRAWSIGLGTAIGAFLTILIKHLLK